MSDFVLRSLQPPSIASLAAMITPISLQFPIYHAARPTILPWLSDKTLNLVAPVLVYWVLSMAFHALDTAKIPYFEARRIHESPEVLSRNRTTVGQVVRAVLLQQIIQVALGYVWFEDEEVLLRREIYVDHLSAMAKYAPRVADAVLLLLGSRTGDTVLRNHGQAIVRWVYWWGVPIAQLFFACFVIDTWQYFWHRAMHTSRFLYRHFHSVHHKLYVPYAFGALYNHPVEGFILDSLGAAIAAELSRMTNRQAIFLFTISTIKTIDDHCGYRLWWDPCQAFFNNNVDYHDIHHQTYGIKANFSQPFFTNWDRLLGTQMTRDQADAKIRPKAE